MESNTKATGLFCTRQNAFTAVLACSVVTLVILYTVYGSNVPTTELRHNQQVDTRGYRPPESSDIHTQGDPEQHPTMKQKIGRKSDRLCTFALFRQYFQDYRYFPASGKWDLKQDPPSYQPDFCKFKQRPLSRDYVQTCLAGSDISSLTTIGDSNAMRYHEALRDYIGECSVLRAEEFIERGFMPDKSYFVAKNPSDTEWEETLEVHERHCSGCASQQSVCRVVSGQTDATLDLEHLAMTMIVDDSLQIRFPVQNKTAHTLDNLWAITSQETMFRYYMKGRYPDILLVFFPSNHAKHLGMERLRLDMEYIRSLIHLYVPKTTKIVYFATFSEFESKREGKQWINATFENMLAAEKIDKMNRLMFDVMRNDLLNSTGSMYGFLDMVDVTKSLVDWSTDGVHMVPAWYQAAMAMFLETLCNSVKLGAF